MMTVRLSGFCDCEGCWRRVNDALSGIKGIKGRLIDKKKFLVTVTGTVDTEALKARLAKIRRVLRLRLYSKVTGKRRKKRSQKRKLTLMGPIMIPNPMLILMGPIIIPNP